MWLYATPGLDSITTQGDQPIVGTFQQNGRAFFVAGLGFYEILANDFVILRGSVASTTTPATICSNGVGGNQLLIVTGLYGYVFNLLTNVLTYIADLDFPQGRALMCAFLDGYGLVLVNDGTTFQWSALEDFTDWDALDFAAKSQTSDNILSLVVDIDRKVIWLIGGQNTELWYDSGNADQPFIPVPNALVSQGTAASFGFILVDDAVLWIGESNNGSRMAMEGTGTSARRVSTHAVEFAWSQFSVVDDCIGWGYEYRGHSFAVFSFPTAESTWVYDRTEQAWHEWLYWNATTGAYESHLARCHMYAFNRHMVGSRIDGTLYALTSDVLTDDGAPIQRMRRFPHIADENQRISCSKLQADLQVGVGLDNVASTAVGYDPQARLRISRDAGRTYGNMRAASMGKTGAYTKRVMWWRNGQWRDGVIELTWSDPTVIALVNMYADLDGGTN